MRKVFAFLVSPFPGALIQSVVVAVWPKKEGYGVFAHPESMFVFMCLLVYVFGLVLGVPAAIFLARRKLVNLRSYVVAGIGVILTPIVIVVSLGVVRQSVTAYAALYNLAYFCLSGACAGALFWSISRPDRRLGVGFAPR